MTVLARELGAAITTTRLALTPLAEADAAQMAVVLGDERLHEFIGGRPATPAELKASYRRLAAGSGRPDELWLNWIVRLVAGPGQAVGTVQATVTADGADLTAAVAWVVGAGWQRNGYAGEAASALVSWLAAWRPVTILACIHREHLASQRVAARAGLAPTDRDADGEQVWELAVG